jgi:hypothetical protein
MLNIKTSLTIKLLLLLARITILFFMALGFSSCSTMGDAMMAATKGAIASQSGGTNYGIVTGAQDYITRSQNHAPSLDHQTSNSQEHFLDQTPSGEAQQENKIFLKAKDLANEVNNSSINANTKSQLSKRFDVLAEEQKKLWTLAGQVDSGRCVDNCLDLYNNRINRWENNLQYFIRDVSPILPHSSRNGDCPRDASALSNQIKTDVGQSGISQPISDLIQGGGEARAIAMLSAQNEKYKNDLNQAEQTAKSSYGGTGDPLAFNCSSPEGIYCSSNYRYWLAKDAILLTDYQIAAIECYQSQNSR